MKVAVALGGGVTCLTAILIVSPLLAFALINGMDDGGLGCNPEAASAVEDGTPSILGPATLTQADLTLWWDSTGRGQPPDLTIPIDELIASYLDEAATDGVRGDIAFAQAVHETGHFTSSDTAINNFAGIAHYDGAASGQAFPDPATAVRAHVQLLKKYANGNDTTLQHPDVSPDAGAHATTWGALAGTWATDPSYWNKIGHLYTTMLTAAGLGQMTDPLGGFTTCPADDALSGGGEIVTVRGIQVHEVIATQLEALLVSCQVVPMRNCV